MGTPCAIFANLAQRSPEGPRHLHRIPAELGQESQASSCLGKGTPLASRVVRGFQAPGRAVCGTLGSFRMMHGGVSAPSCNELDTTEHNTSTVTAISILCNLLTCLKSTVSQQEKQDVLFHFAFLSTLLCICRTPLGVTLGTSSNYLGAGDISQDRWAFYPTEAQREEASCPKVLAGSQLSCDITCY